MRIFVFSPQLGLTCIEAFTPRTHDSQLEEGLEYAEAGKKSGKAAADYAKAHATRWTELLRLPYFNVCRMIIIDPMHALLLGELYVSVTRSAC